MLHIPNIFLIGPMGAGKSTIGRLLAQELKYDFYDSDSVIEEQTGADINWIFDLEGEEGFREREQKAIETLTEKKHMVLATGGGVVLAPANRANLASRGTVIYLSVSIEQQIARISHDNKRPLLRGDNMKQRLTQLAAEREPFYTELADMSFATDNQSARAIVNQIMKALEK